MASSADQERLCRGRPVQTSAVYLVNSASRFPAVPPPSPPSPPTPPEDSCTAIMDELSLDGGPGTPASGDADGDGEEEEEEEVEEEKVLKEQHKQLEVGPPATLDARLADAVHVLSTEAAALAAVSQLYAGSQGAREAFSAAVSAVARTAWAGGRLVVCGVGKSGHIGRKLAATFTSLSVPAAFLHPTEALHGDLGCLGPRDALLLISYSGRTPELARLLPHVDAALPLILLTGHRGALACDLARLRPDAIVLPAPVHEDERASFGLAAPTTSTTVALAVGDALAVVAGREVHAAAAAGGGGASDGSGSGTGTGSNNSSGVAAAFARNHPGGAIGEDNNTSNSSSSSHHGNNVHGHNHHQQLARAARPVEVRHLAVPWDSIPVLLDGCTDEAVAPVAADVLRAGYASASGWVRICRDDGGVVPPSRIRRLTSDDLARPVDSLRDRLVAGRLEFVAVAGDTKIRSAAEWILAAREEGGARDVEGGAAPDVVAVLEHGEIVGVLEIADLLEASNGVNKD